MLAIYNTLMAYILFIDFPAMYFMLLLIKRRGRGNHAMNILIKMIHQINIPILEVV